MNATSKQSKWLVNVVAVLVALLATALNGNARRVSLEGIGISIRYTDRTYRYKSDHLDTSSWDLGLIFPKSTIPSTVSGMEFATHDFRPASEDSRTNDVIDRIKADAAGDLLIAMPSGAASGNGWVRLNGGSGPDFYLDQVGRDTAAAPDLDSPYWFYRRSYLTPGAWVLLPVNSVSTDHPPFVFANKGELYWENPPILPGAVIIARKREGGGNTTVANPCMVVLPNGDYLASISGAVEASGTGLWKSVDKGATWSLLADGFSLNRQSIFEHQEDIYLIGAETRIYRSSNNGATWTSSNFSGSYGYDAPTHVDVLNGRIWKAATVDVAGGVAPGFFSAPIEADLMNEASWTPSVPGTTWGAMIGTYTLANGQKAEVIDEPEGTLLVTKEGRLVNSTKTRIYRPEDGVWKDGIAMIYVDQNDITRTEIDPDYAGPWLRGSTSKYTVRYDPVSDRYWALTSGGVNRGELNLYSASSVNGKIGDFEFEQRILEGHSTSYHGFNYPFMQFDGNDIVFVLRTAWDHYRGTSDRWHDADLFTFHRIENVRQVGPYVGVVNPGFEEGMTGWQTVGDAEADYVQTVNPHTGTNNLAHYKTSAYQVRTYQSLSGMPVGTYTASAWVKCSGGQSGCYFYVSGYGGTELRTNITASPTTYFKLIIPDIPVTSGRCTIGVYSDASAGNWLTVDDVAMVRFVPDTSIWTNLTGGSWAAAGNWSNNMIANGAEVPADFSTLTLSNDCTVTVDGPWTAGDLTFGDVGGVHHWTLDPGSGGSLILANINPPGIMVNNGNTIIAAELAGTNGMVKTGGGMLTLTGANTYTGNTVVSNGMLWVNGSLASGSAVTVNGTATLGGTGTINGPVTFDAGSLAQLTLGSPLTLADSLTVAAGGTLPVVRVDLTNNVPPGIYPLATYNPSGSSGLFDSLPVIGSGSLATGTVASVTTSGGVVSLEVILPVPPMDYTPSPLSNWHWVGNNSGTQVGVLAGDNTPTPAITTADPNGVLGTLYSTFSPVTLTVGDWISYTVQMKTEGTTGRIRDYRVAFFNNGGVVDGAQTSWTGFWGDNDSLRSAPLGTVNPFNFGDGLAAAIEPGNYVDNDTYDGNGILKFIFTVERAGEDDYRLTCATYNSGIEGDEVSSYLAGTIQGYNGFASNFTNTFNTFAVYWSTTPNDTLVAVQSPQSVPGFSANGIEVSGGTVSLTATGAIGASYSLWASPDATLVPIESTWTLVTNGTISGSPFTIVDSDVATNQQRFYLFSIP